MSVPIIDSSLNIKNANRTIDLHSQITKITNKLVIENTGKSPVCNLIFALDARQNNHLNYASTLLREHGRPELKFKKFGDLELKNAHYHKLFYQIKLRDPLQPERSVPVEVELIFMNELTDYYNCSTSLKKIESYTKTKPVTHSDSTLTMAHLEKNHLFYKCILKTIINL